MNSCFLCDKCPFEQSNGSEYQEIHVTVDIDKKYMNDFKMLCHTYNGKSVTIDLNLPTDEIQTMTAISFKGSRNEAYSKAMKFSQKASSFCEVTRIKLECSIFDENSNFNDGYFEGHFAVDIEEEMVYKLREVAKLNDSHTSKNAFKTNVYMITHRYKGNIESFIDNMRNIKEAISSNFNVIKEIKEFCYYDSNVSLDYNWINNRE